MTTTGTTETEIARYLTGVRAALVDLPEDVREELLEDEPAHLAEVLAEGDGPLDSRLGPPERYAAELRTAAGLAAPDPGPTATRRSAAVVQLRERMRRADTTIGPLLGYARASELLQLLRPGWWVLRGYLVGLLILNEFGGGSRPRLWPIYSQSWGWLLVVGVCVVASVRLGQVSPRFGRPGRWALAVGAAFLGFLFMATINPGQAGYDQYSVNYVDPYGGVMDIYPYGPDGQPLSGVALFDQNGTPIQVGDPWQCAQETTLDKFGKPFTGVWPPGKGGRYTYPLCPPEGWQPSVTAPSPDVTPTGSPQPSASPTG